MTLTDWQDSNLEVYRWSDPCHWFQLMRDRAQILTARMDGQLWESESGTLETIQLEIESSKG